MANPSVNINGGPSPVTDLTVAALGSAVSVKRGKGPNFPTVTLADNIVFGDIAVARYVARLAPRAGLYPADAAAASEVDSWIDAAGALTPATVHMLDQHLATHQYVVGHALTVADLVLARALAASGLPRSGNVARWFEFIAGAHPAVTQVAAAAPAASAGAAAPAGGDKAAKGKGKGKEESAGAGAGAGAAPAKAKKEEGAGDNRGAGLDEALKKAEEALAAATDDAARAVAEKKLTGLRAKLAERDAKLAKLKEGGAGSAYQGLRDAVQGQVVTRFPPEPSGYLHIGHAKAAILNYHYAKMYGGKLILRFDDTNPAKEKSEFVENILGDLERLGIKYDMLTHTSDHFDLITEYGKKLLREGKGYVDDTPVEAMREMRGDRKESPCRNNTPEENLALFQEMLDGTPKGLTCCVRGKIDMNANNACMRDPVFFRCNLLPHHRTGRKFKCYPMYDFACPIVDSIEGVTHALRTSEYADREEQYYWVVDALGIRKPLIEDYSRLSFVRTVLSKRKLTWFVETGRVQGWTDPRFPTVQGILRRGMTVKALWDFMVQQGASKRATNQQWDKLWAINKQIIDPEVPRYIAIASEGHVVLTLTDVAEGPAAQKSVLAHKKNPALGNRIVYYSRQVLIEKADYDAIAEGEEVTLMELGNVIIDKKNAKGLTGHTNPAGSVKTTEKKLSWLSQEDTVPALLVNFDHLISVDVFGPDDKIEECLTEQTRFETVAIGDPNLRYLKKGERIQLLRRGYFICDVPAGENQPCVLFEIPDGHEK